MNEYLLFTAIIRAMRLNMSYGHPDGLLFKEYLDDPKVGCIQFVDKTGHHIGIITNKESDVYNTMDNIKVPIFEVDTMDDLNNRIKALIKEDKERILDA